MRKNGCAVLVVVGCLAWFAPAQATSAIPASERSALIALYDAANGPGWPYRTNWRNATDTDFAPAGTECTWQWVTCDAAGSHVVRLWLSSNNLAGSIPPEIGQLAGLEELRLGENQLSGPIQPQIATLANLRILDLADNALSGAIPPTIANLTALEELWLFGNQLSGPLPAELGQMTSLRILDLECNQLSGGIPPQLGNLTGLQYLYLGSNQLSGPIPSEMGNMTSLAVLLMRDNQLSGAIPASLGALANLQSLWLPRNHLSGEIPAALGNLFSLQCLGLASNQLRGEIPASLANLTAFLPDWLDLRWNALHASDPTLRAFLGAHQRGGDWESTQTVAPSAPSASAFLTTVSLNWTSIPFSGTPGGYRVWLSTLNGGPYNLVGTTADKLSTGVSVPGLSPFVTYYFVAETISGPHAGNSNTVVSERTPQMSARTGGRLLDPRLLTVTPPGRGGTVSSAKSGLIACGGVCSAVYADGTALHLEATPARGFVFTEWRGACSGPDPVCDLLMDANKAVTAVFSMR